MKYVSRALMKDIKAAVTALVYMAENDTLPPWEYGLCRMLAHNMEGRPGGYDHRVYEALGGVFYGATNSFGYLTDGEGFDEIRQNALCLMHAMTVTELLEIANA